MPDRKPKDLALLIDDSKKDRAPWVREWDVCRHYLRGRQHLRFDRQRQDFAPLSSERLRGRSVTNLILPRYRTVVSKLQVIYPSVGILPAGTSMDNVTKAIANEQILRYYWGVDRLKYVIMQMIEWAAMTGTSGLIAFYDSEDRRVHSRAIRSYDMFFEAESSSPDESQFRAIRSFVHRDDLKKTFTDKADAIDETADATESADSASTLSPVTLPDGRIEVFEIYFNDGSWYVLMGEQVLDSGTSPQQIQPVNVLRYTRIPGEIWGMGMIAPIISLQDQYNFYKAQYQRAIKLTANPKILLPRTANVAKTAFNDQPGEGIYFDGGAGKPEYMRLPSMPADVDRNLSRIVDEINEVSGVSESTLGQTPSGTPSGVAIQSLAVQNNTALQITQEDIERVVAAHASNVLVLMQTHYEEPQGMRMMDELGRVIVRELRGTDIIDNPEITIEAGSLFRWEAENRDAKVLQLVQLGIMPPQDAARELSFKTGNRFLMDKLVSLSRAKELLEVAKHAPILGIEGVTDDSVSVVDGQQVVGGIVGIEVTAKDADAFDTVWGEFIGTIGFYELSPERQDYISKVLHSIRTAGQDVAAFQDATQDNVYPRPVRKPGDVAGTLAAVDNLATANQVAGGAQQLQQREKLLEARRGAQAAAGQAPSTEA